MTPRYHLPLAILIILVCSSIASAAIVTQSFTGIINQEYQDFPGVSIGETVNVSVKYNTDTPDTDSHPNVGVYFGAILSIEVGLPDTGDYWLIEATDDSNHNEIVIKNDIDPWNSQPPYEDEFDFLLDGLVSGPSIDGMEPLIVFILFFETQWDSIPTMLVDDSLPLSLGEYQTGYAEFFYDDSFENLDALGFVPIPIPAAAWLFGSGLVGFVGLRRKMKK